ncbi:MAG: trypsin-like peptidase domain-containing protein [Patescibacteria group bacterium]
MKNTRFLLVVGVLALAVFGFWYDDHRSVSVTSSEPSRSTSSPTLYKPAVEYEKAVVDAIKKSSSAVVAITISKNVPILENCPVSPFSDLPPEFRQFFGGDIRQFSAPCNTGKTQLQEVGGGSGFIVSSDGLILTNKHVVADPKASYTVFTNDGKKYTANVLARDPSQDIAVIKIEATGLSVVELGDSDMVQLGQTAIAIGNALGEFRNTVSVGVISGLARTVTAGGLGVRSETIQGVIQTDAAINHGNSGGPLLNLQGQVIGINTAIAEGAQNIGFSIPINRVKHDIDSVKKTAEIRTPFLGVRYLMISPEIARDQKLSIDHGALVRGSNDGPAVAEGSPAALAGIQAEDIIIKVNETLLDQDHPLGDEIAKHNVGDRITLTINRTGKELPISVTLSQRLPAAS